MQQATVIAGIDPVHPIALVKSWNLHQIRGPSAITVPSVTSIGSLDAGRQLCSCLVLLDDGAVAT